MDRHSPPGRSHGNDSPQARGLLINTLVRSSRAQAVLPAYLRHPTIQDVVFVYNNYVLVRELNDNKLQTLTIKDDFDSTIHAVRVLGSLNPSDARLSSDFEDGSIPDPHQQPWPDQVDADGDTAMDVACHGFQPQVLVATLERGKRDSLAFLYASRPDDVGASPNACELAHFQRPLPPPQDDRNAHRFGRHLAVDSGSRLIAVAANENHIVLYRLKPRSKWTGDAPASAGRSAASFDPIAEEARLMVNGNIHKMEFLESPKSDPNIIVLLLILSFDTRKTVMQRYDWDSTKPLSRGISLEWAQGYPLDHGLLNSQILMPLSTETGFIFVVADLMVRFTEVLSGSPKVTYFKLPTQESARARREPTSSPLPVRKDLTHWTAWAKPLRRTDFSRDYDHFYLCREDGMFQFCELTRGSGSLLSTNIKLDITNDTAFAVLDADGYSELAVTSNGLFRLFVQKDPRCEQPFSDWSPLQNFESIRHGTKPSIIACSGHGQGLHSKNIHSIYTAFKATCEEVQIGASRVFGLPSGDDICLVSSVEDTRLYPIPIASHAKIEVDPQLSDLFEARAPTLATGRTRDGVTVQVTPHAIRASSPGAVPTVFSLPDADSPAVIAAFDSERGDLLLIVRRNQNFLLQYFRVTSADKVACLLPSRAEFSSDALKIFSQPTAASIARVRKTDTVWAIVGTWDNELLLVKIGAGHAPFLAHKLKSPTTLFESVRILDHDASGSSTSEVICGLRDGSVERYLIDDERERLSRCERVMLGLGPVSVEILGKDVLAVCDERLYKAPFDYLQSHKHLRFWSVACFQDDGYQLRLSVMRVSVLPQWANRADFVLLETDSHPHLARMESKVSQVAEPRMFFVQDTYDDSDGHRNSNKQKNTFEPTHVLATSHGVVVAYQEAVLMERRGGRNGDTNGEGHLNGNSSESSKRRQIFSRLGLLDGDAALQDVRNSDTDVVIGGHSGNIVQGISEWKFESPRLKSSVIAVSVELRRQKKDNRPTCGRVYLFSPRKDPKSPSELAQVYRLKFPEAVFTTAQTKDDEFVVCHGRSISLVQLRSRTNPDKPDSSASEFRVIKTVELRSSGRSIATRKVNSQRVLLYIATKDSLEILDESLNHLAYGPGYCEIKGNIVLTGGPDSVTLLPTTDAIKGYQDKISEQLVSTPGSTNGEVALSRFAVQQIFEAKLMSTITQVRDHPSKPGVFLGSNRSGAFHQLRIITHDEWQLLKFIQHLAEQDPEVCPFTYGHKLQLPRLSTSWRPGIEKTEMHVDGDIIARAIRRGVPQLEQLIRNAVAGDYDLGLHDASGRFERLEELAVKAQVNVEEHDLESMSNGHNETHSNDSASCSTDQIIIWLQNMLDPCT